MTVRISRPATGTLGRCQQSLLDVEVDGARCDGGQRTNLFDAVFRHWII